MRFPDVKILIWDFDGTFYKPNPELFHAVREAEYRTIMGHNGWDRGRTVSEFERCYKKITPSATQTVAKLCNISTSEAAQIMESYFDRRKYLSRDQRLVDLFRALTTYKHFILANGTKRRITETLVKLGVPPEIFVEIVTSEQSGENKPSDLGFRYIMKKTSLPPEAHLMIGDREAVDLVPAKIIGMHTCLVWTDTPSTTADVTVSSVYDVAALFTAANV